MFSALILCLMVLVIVVASRRWPDVEGRLFAGQQGLIPVHQTAEPVQYAMSAPETSSKPTAGGLMQTRPLATEPDVDPSVFSKTPVAPAAPVEEDEAEVVEEEATLPEVAEADPEPEVEEEPEAPASPSPSFAVSEVTEAVATEEDTLDDDWRPERLPDEPTVAEVTDEAPAEPAAIEPVTPSAPAPAAPSKPGAHVTGTPAVPNEPAFYDATKTEDSIERLGALADQAYRDRDYQRAEQACLKILVKDPKNHKYMTRIGQVYQEMGNLEDAKEAFEAAKQLDPKNFFVLNRLSEVTRLLDDKHVGTR